MAKKLKCYLAKNPIEGSSALVVAKGKKSARRILNAQLGTWQANKLTIGRLKLTQPGLIIHHVKPSGEEKTQHTV